MTRERKSREVILNNFKRGTDIFGFIFYISTPK